jgi:predicted acyltransferase
LLHQLNGVHQIFIISKNLATVPWALLSSAYTIWVWIAIYWLVDIKNIRGWIAIVRPAGENPLFAFILAPFVIEIINFFALIIGSTNFYYWLGETFILGFLRAVLLAFSMTWLAGYLGKIGLRLKL